MVDMRMGLYMQIHHRRLFKNHTLSYLTDPCFLLLIYDLCTSRLGHKSMRKNLVCRVPQTWLVRDIYNPNYQLHWLINNHCFVLFAPGPQQGKITEGLHMLAKLNLAKWSLKEHEFTLYMFSFTTITIMLSLVKLVRLFFKHPKILDGGWLEPPLPLPLLWAWFELPQKTQDRVQEISWG